MFAQKGFYFYFQLLQVGKKIGMKEIERNVKGQNTMIVTMIKTEIEAMKRKKIDTMKEIVLPEIEMIGEKIGANTRRMNPEENMIVMTEKNEIGMNLLTENHRVARIHPNMILQSDQKHHHIPHLLHQ